MKPYMYIFLFLGAFILSVYLGQIDSLITGENPSIKISPMIFANPVVLILTMFVLYPILRYIIRVSRNISYKIDAFNDIQTLNREINVKYNPSIWC